MNFLISDTFTDSLARLTGDEQKAVKTTAFDLMSVVVTVVVTLASLYGLLYWIERDHDQKKHEEHS